MTQTKCLENGGRWGHCLPWTIGINDSWTEYTKTISCTVLFVYISLSQNIFHWNLSCQVEATFTCSHHNTHTPHPTFFSIIARAHRKASHTVSPYSPIVKSPPTPVHLMWEKAISHSNTVCSKLPLTPTTAAIQVRWSLQGCGACSTLSRGSILRRERQHWTLRAIP